LSVSSVCLDEPAANRVSRRTSELWSASSTAEKEAQAFAISGIDGEHRVVYGAGSVAFELLFGDAYTYQQFLAADLYSAARDFVEGRFDVRGDLTAAVFFKATHPGTASRRLAGAVLALASSWRLESVFQPRQQAKSNIEFHYDRSNEFYQAFLDSRMVYSCAYFQTPSQALEDAQLQKLNLICRKLDLRPNDTFLDIGCGWGALLLQAASTFGAVAKGCTLSTQQANYARVLADRRGLADRVAVNQIDFRAVRGRFDKIASVGMFEHVGRERLRAYFAKVFDILGPEGLFLNHGIIRPQGVNDGPETRFLRNYVFPGGELAHLADVIKAAEDAGFEVLDVESLRPHYALTCRHWVRRLAEKEDACVSLVGQEAYRTWLLYLAGAALSFEEGGTDVYQVLLAKRSGRMRRLTRTYMLEDES
jgi:cyclopropane-fatty-acyl-phospholipid synthase